MVSVNVVWNIKSTTNEDACAQPWQSMPGNHCKSQQGQQILQSTWKQLKNDIQTTHHMQHSITEQQNYPNTTKEIENIPHSYPKEGHFYGGRITRQHKSSEKNMGTN